jgi:hypothetical protein
MIISAQRKLFGDTIFEQPKSGRRYLFFLHTPQLYSYSKKAPKIMFNHFQNFITSREMKNISGGSTLKYFVTILTEGSMQDNTVKILRITSVQTPFSPYIKCNVLRDSLSEDSQNIPCATLKRMGRG